MCRKGENIRKRKDGRWEARYIKCRDPEGKIHYGSLYGKTYGEVKDKRNKKIAEVPGYGHLVRNPGILNYQATFETVAEHWKHEIRIQRTVIRIKNLDQTANPDTGKIPKTILYIGPPKTEHSNREIPLPDKLLFYAKRFRKDGSAYILSGTVRCMEPRVIQRRYVALLKTCGIPPIKIHALRHQFSCRWVEHGFDTKSLSEILGHTSVRTTLDLYVHIQAETKRQYMNQMMEQAI